MNKITLFLMSKKGYVVLKEILSSFNPKIIDFIVFSDDKNMAKDYSKGILNLCEKHNLKVFNKTEDYQVKSNYAFAISWRWLISLDQNQTKLIIFHDSLLPKYRGFSPLVNQLINKEPIIGVTAFFAHKEFDKGPIINQEKTAISYPIKICEVIEKITVLYKNLALKIISQINNETKLITTSQNDTLATYSLWRDTKDYEIKWSKSSSYIHTFINAVGFPYLGASTQIQGRTVRIFNTEIEEDVSIVNRDCGKIIFIKNSYPIVVCGKGLLKITEAIYDDTKKPLLPLQKFRLRFHENSL